MLRKVGESAWPISEKDAVVSIKDASYPIPFTQGLEFNSPAHGCLNIVHTGMLIPEAHQIYVCADNCMSGVMLTAAAEAIPVLCTNVGSLAEYIDDGCVWVIPNDDKSICENLQKILNGETKDSLAQMGKKFQQYVNKRYDWNTIVYEIVKDCY